MLFRRAWGTGLLGLVWMVQGLRADGTVRYHLELQVRLGALAALTDAKPPKDMAGEIVLRLKNGRIYAQSGDLVAIADSGKHEYTLIDPNVKEYCILTSAELSEFVRSGLDSSGAKPQMPPLQTTVESRQTGRTAVIQGIQAEEREVRIAWDLPDPEIPGNTPKIEIVIRLWSATAAEAKRLAAIGEFMEVSAVKEDLQPIVAATLSRIQGLDPRITEVLSGIIQEHSFLLDLRVEVHAPFLVALQKLAIQGDQAPPVLDPEAPIVVMEQRVVELSDALVDASVFEMPKEYKHQSFADLLMRDGAREASATAAPLPSTLH